MSCVLAYTQQQIIGIPQKKTRLPHLQRHRQTFNKPKLAVFVPFVHKYDCTMCTILKLSLGMAAISTGGKMTNIAASREKTTIDNRHLTLCEVKRLDTESGQKVSQVIQVLQACFLLPHIATLPYTQRAVGEVIIHLNQLVFLSISTKQQHPTFF